MTPLKSGVTPQDGLHLEFVVADFVEGVVFDGAVGGQADAAHQVQLRELVGQLSERDACITVLKNT